MSYTSVRRLPARVFACVALIALLLVCVAGCSKKSGSSGAADSKVPAQELLNYLPSSTVALSSWDLRSDGHARLRKSQYGKALANLSRSAEQMLKEHAAVDPHDPFLALNEAFKRVGMHTFVTDENPEFASGVTFVALPQDGKSEIGWASYVQLAGGRAAAEKLGQMREVFEAKGLTPKPYSGPGFEALAVTGTSDLEGDAANPLAKELYIVAAGDRISAASTRALAERVAGDAPAEGLLASSDFKKDVERFPDGADGRFSLVYVNTKELISKQPPFVSDTDWESFQQLAKVFPIGNVVGGGSMDEFPKYTLSAELVHNEDSKQFRELIGKAGKLRSVTALPANSVFVLGLDGALIRAAAEAAAAQGGAADPQQLAMLDTIDGMAVGIGEMTGASPFPDLYISLETDKPAEIAQVAKLMSAAGGVGGSWQSKQLENRNVEYMLTPLGVGIYLSQLDNGLIVSSSERAMELALRAASDSGKSLEPKISAVSKPSDGTLMVWYADGNGLVRLAESIQGSLAMFTGGQSAFDVAALAPLKDMGAGTMTLKSGKDFLTIESALHGSKS